jgi:hypothetical protein
MKPNHETGRSHPLGATLSGKVANFSRFSRSAARAGAVCSLFPQSFGTQVSAATPGSWLKAAGATATFRTPQLENETTNQEKP